jgi:KaiC/GvpD/RAD55 family RecA-like ATPase
MFLPATPAAAKPSPVYKCSNARWSPVKRRFTSRSTNGHLKSPIRRQRSVGTSSHISKTKNLAILDASPYFSGRSPSAGEKGIDPQKIVADLGNYVRRLSATLLVIDPVTPFILPIDATSPAQDQARALINLLQTQLTTTNLLTAHFSSRADQDQTCGIEEFLASGAFHLKIDNSAGQVQRTLAIRKMRGTPVIPGDHNFEMTTAAGIVIANQGSTMVSRQQGTKPVFEYFELPKK